MATSREDFGKNIYDLVDFKPETRGCSKSICQAGRVAPVGNFPGAAAFEDDMVSSAVWIERWRKPAKQRIHSIGRRPAVLVDDDGR